LGIRGVRIGDERTLTPSTMLETMQSQQFIRIEGRITPRLLVSGDKSIT
jgi:hypothetical protein